jgi:hypothetical protein
VVLVKPVPGFWMEKPVGDFRLAPTLSVPESVVLLDKVTFACGLEPSFVLQFGVGPGTVIKYAQDGVDASTAVAVAPVPPPPENAITASDARWKHWVPAALTVTDVIEPLAARFATAVAPDPPPPPVMLIVGALVYVAEPPVVKVIVLT